MNAIKQTKINLLLQKFPAGALYFGAWLSKNGVSYSLQRHYRDSGWLTAIDSGVMYRTGDKPNLYSALSCFDGQMGKRFYVGAMSALEMRGFAHYVPLGRQNMVVYCPHGDWFPKWFFRYDFGAEIVKRYAEHSEVGLEVVNVGSFEVLTSSPERAFLESLSLAGKFYHLTDLYQVMETLGTLRPALLQRLLEECTSVKVKRLFLYMAERGQHAWYKKLDVAKIDLGKGKRSLVKNGVYNAKYQITLPKDLVSYE